MAEWRFFLDENIDPKVVTYLEKENLYAEHVRDTLGQGADDEDDILPYAREKDLIVVTSDVQDFAQLSPDDHTGVILLYDDSMPAYRITAGLIAIVDSYPGRSTFAGHEILDGWV